MIWVSEVSKESHINMPMLRFLFIYFFNYSFFVIIFYRGWGKIRTPLHKILHPPQEKVLFRLSTLCCGI